MLTDTHGYANNAVQAKIYGPFEASHSDDILNFFPITLLRYSVNDPYHPRSFKVLNAVGAMFAATACPYGMLLPARYWAKTAALILRCKNCSNTRSTLLTGPWKTATVGTCKKIRWQTVGGSYRRCIPYQHQKAVYHVGIPIPKDWIQDGGATEETGTYFLFAYWMGRYYGFWE